MANDYIYRLRKPLAGAQLNYGNPLANGLVLCVPFWERLGRPIDVSPTRTSVSFVGPAGWISDTGYQEGTSGHYIDFGNPSQLQFGTSSNITVFVVAAVNGGDGSFRNIIRYDPGGPSRNLLLFRLSNTNTLDFIVGPSSTLGSVSTTQTVLANTARQRAFCAVRDASADRLRIYLDGAPSAEATDASGSFSLSGTTWQTRYSNPASEAFNGYYSLVLIYNRALSATEVSALSAYPWQIFQSQSIWSRRYQFTPGAISGTSSLTAPAATLAASGTVTHAYTGTSALTAAAATLSATGTVVSPAAGFGSNFQLLGIG